MVSLRFAPCQDIQKQPSRARSTAGSRLKDASGRVTIQAKKAGLATITARFDNRSSALQIKVLPVVMVSLQVNPTSVTLSKGTIEGLSVTASYNNGSVRKVTDQVFWQVGDNSIAQMGGLGLQNGVLSALKEGSTTVQAKFQNLSSNAIAVTVSGAVLQSITVTPVEAVLTRLRYTTYQAIGHYSDGSTQNITREATWFADGQLHGGESRVSISNNNQSTRANPNGTKGRAEEFGLIGIASCLRVPVTAVLGNVTGRADAIVKGLFGGDC
jgi:hypothetical protein